MCLKIWHFNMLAGELWGRGRGSRRRKLLQCVALPTHHLKHPTNNRHKINYEPLASTKGSTRQAPVSQFPAPCSQLPAHSSQFSVPLAESELVNHLAGCCADCEYAYFSLLQVSLHLSPSRFASCSRIKYLFSKILMEPKKLSVQLLATGREGDAAASRVLCVCFRFGPLSVWVWQL